MVRSSSSASLVEIGSEVDSESDSMAVRSTDWVLKWNDEDDEERES